MAKTIFLWTKSWLIKKDIPSCFLEQALSSNDLAKQRAFTSPPFAVFLVHQQSRGRGQGGAKWENSDLMMTVSWTGSFKKLSADSCKNFTVDLKEALKALWPELPLRVKTPNDLYLNTKKTAGILLEVIHQGSQTAFIVGLGLNALSCPRNLPSACLAEYTKNIDSNRWEDFLEKLFILWNKRVIPV